MVLFFGFIGFRSRSGFSFVYLWRCLGSDLDAWGWCVMVSMVLLRGLCLCLSFLIECLGGSRCKVSVFL